MEEKDMLVYARRPLIDIWKELFPTEQVPDLNLLSITELDSISSFFKEYSPKYPFFLKARIGF